MTKWLDEKILIKYWEERCHTYHLRDGTLIKSSKRNPSFGYYPDISENVLGDGTTVPCEIEWFTTNFDKHGHDIKVLVDSGGFIVVLKNDASALVEQIEIRRDDFIEWFSNNAEAIAHETLTAIDRQARRNKEPQIFLYYVPRTGAGARNFQIALAHGVWGFPEKDGKLPRGWTAISEVKPGDIVVAVHNFTANTTVGARGGRLSPSKFVGAFQSITGLVVTSNIYRDETTVIWPDQQYPGRFRFRTPFLFQGHNITCTKLSLGGSLHEILRRLLTNGSMQKIDGLSMTKLMSLCTQ
ncbi:hypothetical protein O6V14_09445 [Sphingomonas faeni]|uniref:hypothetical protein n=1 Tax=Sphingomonas faeni TaxID=185950 RepID=UPI0033614C5D